MNSSLARCISAFFAMTFPQHQHKRHLTRLRDGRIHSRHAKALLHGKKKTDRIDAQGDLVAPWPVNSYASGFLHGQPVAVAEDLDGTSARPPLNAIIVLQGTEQAWS
jgi:hypothetical protein